MLPSERPVWLPAPNLPPTSPATWLRSGGAHSDGNKGPDGCGTRPKSNCSAKKAAPPSRAEGGRRRRGAKTWGDSPVGGWRTPGPEEGVACVDCPPPPNQVTNLENNNSVCSPPEEKGHWLDPATPSGGSGCPRLGIKKNPSALCRPA